MIKVKHLATFLVVVYSSLTAFSANAQEGASLVFDPNAFTENTMQYPTGEEIRYRAYENIYYVRNVADPAYQTLNIYVPEHIYSNNLKAPVFLKTNVGGYMASRASAPSTSDATGRALLEGYVVVIPGARGSNSIVENGSKVWTGRAPAGLIDLKAAIRYLRHNSELIPGDTERIITDGTSAGGAMSALLGATGNYPVYEPYLEELGAAEERDDIFAAVCYCPITNLEHADMAYEWLYRQVRLDKGELTDEQDAISKELAAQFPAYLNSLELKDYDGMPLTDANYLDYIKSFLIESAQRARNEGFDLPDTIGVVLNNPNRIVQGDLSRRPARMPMRKGEIVTDIDMNTYLKYVDSQRRLKPVPAFDAMGVAGASATAENNLFGNAEGSSVNYTAYSLRKATGRSDAALDEDMQRRVYLMNPMNFIGSEMCVTAPNWYIRHGALDRDTSFPIPVNLYTRLENEGYNVDFFLPWNRNHSGDYNLDDLFEWLSITIEGAE